MISCRPDSNRAYRDLATVVKIHARRVKMSYEMRYVFKACKLQLSLNCAAIESWRSQSITSMSLVSFFPFHCTCPSDLLVDLASDVLLHRILEAWPSEACEYGCHCRVSLVMEEGI